MCLFSLLLGAAGMPAHAEMATGPTQLRFYVTGSRWAVTLPKQDWQVREERNRDGELAYHMLSSESLHAHFSVYIDHSRACDSGESCRQQALKNPLYRGAKGLRKFRKGDFDVAQFRLDKPGGLAIQQSHLLAEAYRDGFWIDVHLSQSAPTTPDPAELLKLLDTITLNAQP